MSIKLPPSGEIVELIVYNIEWDFDPEDEPEDLPTAFFFKHVMDERPWDEVLDEITEHLTEETDFCVSDYSVGVKVG